MGGVTEVNGVVLAGGSSSRMGVVKALLPVAPGDARTLAERQLALLRRSGAARVFLSLRRDGPLSLSAHLGESADEAPEVVYDEGERAGPLGGIVAAMRRAPNLHLLVLAVDMASVGPGLLSTLLAECTAEAGAAPRVSGRFEALCAIYPPHALAAAEGEVRGPRRSPSALLARLEGQDLVRPVKFGTLEAARLKSWNRPEDLPLELRARIARDRSLG